jgi:GntR family transcriptional repressor for pyruvate dehydrogenase complex
VKAAAARAPRVMSQLPLRPPGTTLTDDASYIALRELGESQTPIGCWKVGAALQAAGIVASEATAGRLLRVLDLQGLTRALGSKGRVLTARGRRYLAALEHARRRHSYHSDLLQAVRAETVDHVRDLLTARRAVEAETVRLAALRATRQEIRQIEHAVHRHIEETHRRGVSIEENRAIHGLIARASRSRILQAVVNVLLQEEYLQEIQTRIQRAADGVRPGDHLVILQAIKDRRPEQAAEAMRAHIDRLIRVVERYTASPKAGTRRRTQVEGGTPLP